LKRRLPRPQGNSKRHTSALFEPRNRRARVERLRRSTRGDAYLVTTSRLMADTSIARTGEVAASKNVHEIIKEAKRIEETTLYSSKGHFAAAENWSKLHLWIGVPNAGLAAVAGAMALSFTTQAWIHVLGGGLAIVAAGLASLQTFLNPNEK